MNFKNIAIHAASILTMACGALSTHAVPAYPGLIKATQPDGTQVEIYLQGDEYFSWATTPSGYTLMRDAQGFLAYATANPFTGTLEPSAERYFGTRTTPATLPAVKPGLRFTSDQIADARSRSALTKARAKAPVTQVDGTFPTKGKNKLLMLLVNYADTQPIYSQEDFNNYMNATGYNGIGSFRDFYLQNSYGKLDIETTVTRWVTLPNQKAYYGTDRAIEMIRDALNMLDSELDLRDFDNDGDGILDGLAVIHQGAGQEASSNYADIWSHSSVIYGMEFDGVQVRRYTIEPELLGTTTKMSTIGVMCHEFGHNLGAPDFYDTDYGSSGGNFHGTGVWDLMANGAWNGDQGDRPTCINMWQKIQMGWVDPVLLGNTISIKEMPDAEDNAVAYRMNTTLPYEYFILENRQQKGAFDRTLPGHGLIIYHVDENRIDQTISANTLNVGPAQAIYAICAGSGIEPASDASSFGNVNSDECPFPGSKHITGISDVSRPSVKSNTGRYSYMALSEISESADGNISFSFIKESAPAAPQHLTASSTRGLVTLNWGTPEESTSTVRHYNVMRNGVSIATTTDLTYVDRNPGSVGTLTYQVDALYNNGLTSPYTEVMVSLPSNRLTDIESTVVAGQEVRLDWALDTRLTRMDSDPNRYDMAEFNVASLDYVHRFRADDLKAYTGYKIRRIGFHPLQSPQLIKCTLRIWEAEPGSLEPTVVSERVLKEFGAWIWNETLLSKTYEITGTKDVWIGVHVESTVGAVQLMCDRGQIVDGYGNFIRLGSDSEWQAAADVPGNFYLFGTLVAPADDPDRDVFTLDGDTDTYIDMFYPVGHAVYRDDMLLGTTGSRHFTDRSPLGGNHIYSVSCLYKGGNESGVRSLDVNADISTVALDGVGTSAEPTVRAGAGAIVIDGYEGHVTVCDTAGHIVYSGHYATGMTVTAPAGICLVRCGTKVMKAVVR